MSGLRGKPRHLRRLLVITVLVINGPIGCGLWQDPSGGSILGFIEEPTSDPNNQSVGSEVGGSLGSPQPVPLSAAGTALIAGSIDGAGDVDVYDIGPIFVGDRIKAEASTSDGLDAAAALFDGNANLIALNDNRYYGPGGYDPLLNVVSRRSSTGCLLAVSTSPWRTTSGAYTISVTVTRAAAVVEDRPQVVVLDFDGEADVHVGGRNIGTLPPFDAAAIDPSYAGRTQAMINAVLAYVRSDYTGLNVWIYASGDPAIPEDDITTVYFGGYDPGLLGLADYVDVQNANFRQSAIVYTDTFSLFMPFNPSVERMAQVLANVASHEAGHLLGLNHTRDRFGIMDITATAYDMLQDQSFRRSPLESGIFSVGLQDGYGMLLETVGGNPSAARLMKTYAGPQDWVEPLDADDPLMTEPLREYLKAGSGCREESDGGAPPGDE